MIAGGVVTTQNKNTPSIVTTAGTVLAANTARIAWSIQNLDTSPLYVRLGPNASTTVFHVALKGASLTDDGTGGTFSQEDGAVYNGIITAASSTPRFVVAELAP